MLAYEELEAALSRLGLMARGGFALQPSELTEFGLADDYRALVMVGNAGPALWDSLSLILTHDQEEHVLDRWTRRVLEPVAQSVGADVVFPFGGPPYMPFQRWAQRAEPVFPSPIGPLIHPRFGMWHAYRGALLFREGLALPSSETVMNPCDTCPERPCLGTCPVEAFSSAGYDVPNCVAHLQRAEGADCLGSGCRARRACPVGQAFIYEPFQAQFHMAAFLTANRDG